jgi:hypothetical protein
MIKHDVTEVYRDLSLVSDCYFILLLIHVLHDTVRHVTVEESLCGGVQVRTSWTMSWRRRRMLMCGVANWPNIYLAK